MVEEVGYLECYVVKVALVSGGGVVVVVVVAVVWCGGGIV